MLDIQVNSESYHVKGAVVFEEGTIALSVYFDSSADRTEQTIAAVGTGVQLFNALSGRAASRHHRRGHATVSFVGKTPLSDLGLIETPSIAWLDSGLIWDFTFWRDWLDLP